MMIEKVLVDEVVKFIQSVRRWAYEMLGIDRAVHFHVMVTPDCLKVSICVCECV